MLIAATVLGLAVRLYQLARPGFLTGVSEYDDGVYFGAAVRLVSGFLPYRDFAMVHPPGIILLMTPLAWLAKAAGTDTGLALARVATALAATASITLAGLLVRHRGVLAVTLACGFLAVYPPGINASHTLLLEPWVVLLCLIAALAVFDGDGIRPRTGPLVWGGVALGFATAIKLWAALPAAVLLLLCWRAPRRGRWGYLLGLLGGFCVPVLPFAVVAPHALYHDVIVAQLSRVDQVGVPEWVRLRSLDGLGDFHSVGPAVAFVAAMLIAAVIGLCSIGAALIRRRGPAPLEAFALLSALLALALFLWPADYYPHYGWFFAPFLGLALALSTTSLLEAWGTRSAGSQPVGGALPAILAGLIAVAVLAMAAVDFDRLSSAVMPDRGARAQHIIPHGACVFADLPALALVSDRFTSTVPGCSPMVDPIGTDYVLSSGHNGVSGAARVPAVRAFWQSVFAHAQFIWLQCGPDSGRGCPTDRRVPWTKSLRLYFAGRFRQVRGPYAIRNLYRRVPPRAYIAGR